MLKTPFKLFNAILIAGLTILSCTSETRFEMNEYPCVVEIGNPTVLNFSPDTSCGINGYSFKVQIPYKFGYCISFSNKNKINVNRIVFNQSGQAIKSYQYIDTLYKISYHPTLGQIIELSNCIIIIDNFATIEDSYTFVSYDNSRLSNKTTIKITKP